MRCKNVHRHSHQLGFLSHTTADVFVRAWPHVRCVCVCVCVCVFVWVCTVGECLSVCEGIGGGDLSSLAVIRYSTWYDMMIQAQLRDGAVWKMWWQGKRKTRLWSDIWEGEKDKGGRERERERARELAKEWARVGEDKWGGRWDWKT